MSSRIRAFLLASLFLAGWLAFVPSEAKSQYGYNGYVARSAVNQYLNGGYGYGGYGAYGSYSYQPRYYGGYDDGYSHGGTAYGNGLGYGTGNAWNGYRSNYPVYGYNQGFGGY